MVARIRTLTASLGFVVLGIIVAGPPSATTALAATTAPELEGAVGADNGMWLRGNTPPGPWLSFGGVLLGPPALASLPSESQTPQQGSPFVVATGADHRLWTFNQQQGWQPLTSSPTFCIDNPTAVVTSAHASGMQLLTVACQGGDHALWFAQTTISANSLAPLPLTFQSLGGIMMDGPAVAAVDPIHQTVDGERTFFANATDGHVWTRTLATGWSPTPWQCLGHLAAGGTLSTQVPSGEVAVFACQGTDHGLLFSHNFGGGWIDTQSFGGILIDGPGVAVGPTTATFFAEGANQSAFHLTITHGGNVFNWTPDGGILQLGASATALLFQTDNP